MYDVGSKQITILAMRHLCWERISRCSNRAHEQSSAWHPLLRITEAKGCPAQGKGTKLSSIPNGMSLPACILSLSSARVLMHRSAFLFACQMLCCLAVAFHFSKVKGSMELVESIHSLLFKSKGKVWTIKYLFIDNLGQRHSRTNSHSV